MRDGEAESFREASPLGERYPLGLVQDSNVIQNNTVRSDKLMAYRQV
ncbi:hypothetical protein H1P_1150028 [Hyella patelloides LEGE 07179]|uniref:Uncharacterized protein n=1 Tax=Hyella patelloides LEGE 07179 TaxID=945734 RepID=A0A563VJW6_9CYAN|nr:hypothetical protein [Hyella patelloides]VEP11718.1 hypothetical protein H1P_1150028 [Hyella patelloides LEGE 07179]